MAELLGPSVRGTAGSDRWTAYGIIDLFHRQVCWAHLKRDFQKWLDWGRESAPIGRAGLEAVGKLFGLWRDFRAGVLDRPALAAALEPVGWNLHAALETGLSCPNKKAARFCRNVLGVYPALWTFARVEGVEPTNNVAERALRRAVIWRKISFGNHSTSGCRFVERILTTVQTLRLQDRQVLDYLRETVAAHRAGHQAGCMTVLADRKVRFSGKTVTWAWRGARQTAILAVYSRARAGTVMHPHPWAELTFPWGVGRSMCCRRGAGSPGGNQSRARSSIG